MSMLKAFTAETATRLTGISGDQLRRWDNSGFFVPGFADENRRRPYSRIYSYTDLVALRAIARLKELGVSQTALKRVRQFFHAHTNDDWTNRRFYVVGSRLYFDHDEFVVAAKPLGHIAEPRVLAIGSIAQDIDERIRRLSHRTNDQFGRIVSERYIMGGAPIIAGTRIPVGTIYSFHRNGFSPEEIRAEFPRLTDVDIAAAIAFVEDPSHLPLAG